MKPQKIRISGQEVEEKEENKIQYPGGATRTKKPKYSLIPKIALEALAARFELGEIKHEGTAWNAQCKEYDQKLTKDWVIAGLEHVINHCMDALNKINGIGPYEESEDLEENSIYGDAGAIMFGGAVLAAYYELSNKK